MSTPYNSWEAWSQSYIAPVVRAHLSSPTIIAWWGDEDIVSINFTVRAFDSSYVLFGPPEPAEGTIEIIDLEQKYNPVLNSGLTDGMSLSFQLGLYKPNFLKDTISWSDLADTGMDWETAEEFYTWDTLYTIQQVITSWQPYGEFRTTEWIYDTATHIVTIHFTDWVYDTLMIDNRAEAKKPRVSDSFNFLDDLLEQSDSLNDFSPTYETWNYSATCVYRDTQARTINDCVTACEGHLFTLPDGSFILSYFDGFYGTGITIYDEDVESYDIKQTSAATYDSVCVELLNPALKQQQLCNFEDASYFVNRYVPLSVDKLYDVQYVQYTQPKSSPNTVYFLYYDWTVTTLEWRASSSLSLKNLSVYGRVLEGIYIPIYDMAGFMPYEIKDNPYIQEENHCQQLVTHLSTFLSLPYSIITFTIRGCPSLWVGANIHITSELYSIDADYTIIEINFSYTGSVSTIITAQRRFLNGSI